MARLFSISSARSTQPVRSVEISSSLAPLSERMSTLVRAWPGIELILEPPSRIPKLHEERGVVAPLKRLSVNSVIARLSAEPALLDQIRV